MFPPPPNRVISIEHGYRDSCLSAVTHTEDAEGKRRRVVLGMSELSNVYSSHHYEPSGTNESQDAATEAADPSCQRQDTSEGMSTPPGQALGKWHGKRIYVSAVRGHHQRQGRDHWNQQIGQEETGDRRGKHHPSSTVEGRTELDLVQDGVDEAKRLLEEAHVEVQAGQNKVTEAAFRVGQAMEEMAQIKKLLEANSEPAGQ